MKTKLLLALSTSTLSTSAALIPAVFLSQDKTDNKKPEVVGAEKWKRIRFSYEEYQKTLTEYFSLPEKEKRSIQVSLQKALTDGGEVDPSKLLLRTEKAAIYARALNISRGMGKDQKNILLHYNMTHRKRSTHLHSNGCVSEGINDNGEKVFYPQIRWWELKDAKDLKDTIVKPEGVWTGNHGVGERWTETGRYNLFNLGHSGLGEMIELNACAAYDYYLMGHVGNKDSVDEHFLMSLTNKFSSKLENIASRNIPTQYLKDISTPPPKNFGELINEDIKWINKYRHIHPTEANTVAKSLIKRIDNLLEYLRFQNSNEGSFMSLYNELNKARYNGVLNLNYHMEPLHNAVIKNNIPIINNLQQIKKWLEGIAVPISPTQPSISKPSDKFTEEAAVEIAESLQDINYIHNEVSWGEDALYLKDTIDEIDTHTGINYYDNIRLMSSGLWGNFEKLTASIISGNLYMDMQIYKDIIIKTISSLNESHENVNSRFYLRLETSLRKVNNIIAALVKLTPIRKMYMMYKKDWTHMFTTPIMLVEKGLHMLADAALVVDVALGVTVKDFTSEMSKWMIQSDSRVATFLKNIRNFKTTRYISETTKKVSSLMKMTASPILSSVKKMFNGVLPKNLSNAISNVAKGIRNFAKEASSKLSSLLKGGGKFMNALSGFFIGEDIFSTWMANPEDKAHASFQTAYDMVALWFSFVEPIGPIISLAMGAVQLILSWIKTKNGKSAWENIKDRGLNDYRFILENRIQKFGDKLFEVTNGFRTYAIVQVVDPSWHMPIITINGKLYCQKGSCTD